MTADAVRAAFPEIGEIENGRVRAGILEAWSTAMTEAGVDDLRDA